MSEQIFVTHAKGKVHIRACPHLSDSSGLTPATPEQVEQNGYCSHCEKEIAGVGRKYFESLDDAFETFGHRTDEAKRFIRDAIAGVGYDAICIPASESYIALGVNGQGASLDRKRLRRLQGSRTTRAPVVRSPQWRWIPASRCVGRPLPGAPHREVGIRSVRTLRVTVCSIHPPRSAFRIPCLAEGALAFLATT